MKKGWIYSLTALIGIIVIIMFSLSAFAETGDTGTTTGALYTNITQLTQPDEKHVLFGSYPQTEIVADPSQCGNVGKRWATSNDYIVDADLYAELQAAEWNASGDVTIDGEKYRRLAVGDASYRNSSGERFFYWSDSIEYHYFKYEPIKWRLLLTSGTDAFLLSEGALDTRCYNPSAWNVAISWEYSEIRSWLNTNFYDVAFTDDEKSAIKLTSVINLNNVENGTVAGNNTEDKIFLLSEAEVYGSNAVQYGFASACSTCDTARQMKSSTYAKAMGVVTMEEVDYRGNCIWFLRSPGQQADHAASVNASGSVRSNGDRVGGAFYGIVPALHINLKTNSPITMCEKITDISLSENTAIYTGSEIRPTVSIEGLVENEDYTVSYTNNVKIGIATVTVKGINDYSGTITKTFKITDANGHMMTKTEAKAATCTATGNTAYWYCSDCKKYFSDSEGTNEIEKGSWIIKAKGHTMTKTEAKAATCTTAGRSAYWYCSVCKKYFSDSAGTNEIAKNSWIINATGHTLTKTAAKAATCTEAGNSAYWYCSACKKYFSDSEGKNAITKNSWVIKAKGHTTTKTAAKAATCTEDGNCAYWYCSTCKKYFSDEECENELDDSSRIIKATGHTLTKTKAKSATCTEEGNSAYWYCNTCKKYFSDEECKNEIKENSWIIDAKGHTISEIEGKEAGCTQDGNIACWYCSTCKKHYADEEAVNELQDDTWIIKATGHTLTKTEARAATCTEDGNIEYWYCNTCKKYFSDEECKNESDKALCVIKATGHNMTKTEAKAPTATEDGNSEYWYCSTCKKYFSDEDGKNEIEKGSWIIKATSHNTNDAVTSGCLYVANPNYIYFGNYPQTEIVSYASQCGTYGKSWGKSSDYIVDATLYAKLKALPDDAWSKLDDAEIDGKKFRRAKRTLVRTSSDENYYYNWVDSSVYRYFIYEPIKWNVLKASSTDAFLLSDIALDALAYNINKSATTWDESYIQDWVNVVFWLEAFSNDERHAIKTTTVINSDNKYSKELGQSGTDGGADTGDYIFLLSEDEVYGTYASEYGFIQSNTASEAYTQHDIARQKKSSTYAKAMGVLTVTDADYLGNCYWWLRSPGLYSNLAAYVNSKGGVDSSGYSVMTFDWGVVPALHLDLTAIEPTYDTSQINDITLSADAMLYTGKALEPEVYIEGLTEGKDFEVSYENNINVGTGTVIVKGIGNCSGEIRKTFEIHKLTKHAAEESSCSEAGNDEYYECSCGNFYKDAKCIYEIDENSWVRPLKEHILSKISAKSATCTENGVAFDCWYCSVCKEHFRDAEGNNKINDDSWDVARIKTVDLEYDLFGNDGTEHTPNVIVKDVNGKTLELNKDYSVTYKNNKETGTGTAIVNFIENYEGTVEKSFMIVDGMTVTGTVKGYSGSGLSIIVEKDGRIIATSHSAEYRLVGIPAGQCKVIASAGGDYVSHTYTVNVEDNLTQNITLCQIGDVDCDGKRTAADLTRMARHLADISPEKDDYTLKLYDTDKSNSLDAADVTHLARYVAHLISSL